MRQEEGQQLLEASLSETANLSQAFNRLSIRLGEYPLLLKLVNSVLCERVRRGEALSNAINYVNKALDKRNLTIFDNRNAQDRSQAIAKTLSVSFELLDSDQYTHYKELVIFPEDLDIPLITVQMLWHTTGDMDYIDTEDLCELLYNLSLLLLFDLKKKNYTLT